MDDSIESLRAHVRGCGFKPGEGLYFIYRNDPGATAPEKLETLICLPVKRR